MGFGSTAANWTCAPFGLAFASPPLPVRLARRGDSRTHYAKGKRSRARGTLPQLCGRTISGLFHSARSGSFRLSLAVLVRYRSSGSVQPWRVVPPDSDGVSRAPPYSGCRRAGSGLRLRGFHPLWRDFPVASPVLSRAVFRSRNPGKQASRFGLVRFRSPLLTRSRLMSLPQGTEMFHFPWCRLGGLCVHPPMAAR